jgi:inorganic pyrophosphatase
MRMMYMINTNIIEYMATEQTSNDYEVDVQIEIPLGSNIKYEYDHNTHELRVDRVLHSPVIYFFNYGYIPNTLSGDGDPLDAIVLCKESLYPTSLVKCKILGVLHTTDESGEDDKIILVPINKVDRESEGYNDITDVKKFTQEKLKVFFKDYKKMEVGKWVEIDETIGNKEKAKKVFDTSIETYQAQFAKDSVDMDDSGKRSCDKNSYEEDLCKDMCTKASCEETCGKFGSSEETCGKFK